MRRDSFGIIGQTSEDPTYLDMGDAAFSTGIMAFSGSPQDIKLLPLFIVGGKLVRHPYDPKWNDPSLTSRDQVKAFFAGLSVLSCVPFHPICQPLRDACLFYAKSWRVNKDILMPADKFYLYKCAKARPPLWLYPLAYINQAMNVFFDCLINPDNEQNQAVCTNIVYGNRWIRSHNELHPDLIGNINGYFNHWRDKKEISLAFVNKINQSIKQTKGGQDGSKDNQKDSKESFCKESKNA